MTCFISWVVAQCVLGANLGGLSSITLQFVSGAVRSTLTCAVICATHRACLHWQLHATSCWGSLRSKSCGTINSWDISSTPGQGASIDGALACIREEPCLLLGLHVSPMHAVEHFAPRCYVEVQAHTTRWSHYGLDLFNTPPHPCVWVCYVHETNMLERQAVSMPWYAYHCHEA